MIKFLSWGIAASLIGLAAIGCSSSDTSKVQPADRGGRGESCQARNDCASGLACVNQRCTQNDFDIAVTAKQCDLIACQTDDDCCTDTLCVSLKAQCAAGTQTACDNFDLECAACKRETCDMTTNRCVVSNTCTTNTDCGLGTCTAGKCVACTDDTQCSTGQKCQAGQCTKDECMDDSQCAAFNKCTAGKCVYTGCQSDRDCYFSTGNPLSKCADITPAVAGGVSKQCRTPCETDAECAGGTTNQQTGAITSTFQKCQAGACVFVGCDNDDQCREYLGLAQANPLSKTKAVCR